MSELKLDEKHTNILFFTNQCQLQCEYCYEAERINNSKPFKAKFSDFKSQLDELGKNDFVNDIVIFGGEPTLCLDEIYKVVKYANDTYPNKFSFYMNTNCLLLSNDKIFNEFVEFYRSNNNIIVTFSYDGCANYRRHDANGVSSSDNVRKCIENFTKYHIPFNISYCLNFFNYDRCIRDFVIITQYEYLNRLVLSINYNELTMKFGLNGKYEIDQKIMSDYKTKCHTIYSMTKKPICEMTCEWCRICNKTQGYNYMTPDKHEYKNGINDFDMF